MIDAFSLHGRVAYITGSSRGLGLAMANELASAGAVVVLHGREEGRLKDAVKELEDRGSTASYECYDLNDRRLNSGAIERILERHGRVDILVNNAGIPSRVPLLEMDYDEWDRCLESNLTSMFVLTREAARTMQQRGWGRIIMISSISILLSRPTVGAYVASKGAVATWTRQLAVELGPSGITVNAIAPGLMLTEMAHSIPNYEAARAHVESRSPLKRCGRPEEIGPVALFLASNASSYVSGQVIAVDGAISCAL